MKKPNYETSFYNVADWLEAFDCEPSKEMRFGMINALCNPDNFADKKGLGRTTLYHTLTLVYLQAFEISVQKGRVEIAGHVFKIFHNNVLQCSKYPGVAPKDKAYVIHMVELVANLDQYPQRYYECVAREWIRYFIREVLLSFSPRRNTHEENARIARALVPHPEYSQLFVDVNTWRGNSAVIQVLIEKLAGIPNMFKRSGWERKLADQLAIHLAAAGKLDNVISKLRKAAS